MIIRMKKLDFKKYLLVLCGLFLLYLAIFYWTSVSKFIAVFFSACSPIWTGCILGYIINILMSFYERHFFPKTEKRFLIAGRRPICMIGAIITLIAAVALILALLIPQLTSCFSLLFESFSKVIDELPANLEKAIAYLNEKQLLPTDIAATLASVNWTEKIDQYGKVVVSGLGSLLDFVLSAISSLFSGVTTAFLSLIFAIYLLAGKERLGSQSKRVLHRYLPEKWFQKLMHFLNVLNDSFHKFIVGQFTEAIILGCLCTLGMLIIRLPYATMIGALIGFTALIPIVGAFVGGAVGAFLILMESPVQALIFLIFLVVLQQLEGNLIYPKVVGSSIGLPGIWVLAVVTVCGSIFGIPGILLGIPTAAAFYRLITVDVQKGLSEQEDRKKEFDTIQEAAAPQNFETSIKSVEKAAETLDTTLETETKTNIKTANNHGADMAISDKRKTTLETDKDVTVNRETGLISKKQNRSKKNIKNQNQK